MKREIGKLVSDGLHKEAISLFTHHHSASLPLHKFVFPPLLKACAILKSPSQGQMLHAHLIKTGFHVDTYTATSLTAFYMKLNLLPDAIKVFDEMPDRNLASLNATISGFSQNGCCREALLVYTKLGFWGFRPNSVTIASVLPACDRFEHGVQVHCWAIKLGVEMDLYVATSLLTMYSNCGGMIWAAKVFGGMQKKNLVSYNAFVSGLLWNGNPLVVLNVFKDMMMYSSEAPNSVTLLCVLSACASLLYLQFGRQVHGFMVKIEMCFDTKVGTALVDMYSKTGCWQWAYDVFESLNDCRNLITWNSMIAGMMLNGRSESAIKLFERLESEGLEPDSATWNSMISGFVQLEMGLEAFRFFKKMILVGVVPSLKTITSLLPACSALFALLCGKEIHGHAIRINLSTDEFMATALIDMYMKCSFPSWARRIFDQFDVKPNDPAFWNAMISGYGRNGEYKFAFEIFDQMLEEKLDPKSTTYNVLLSVCSHTGQVDKGWQLFRMMRKDSGLNPNPEHFGCMVDLLGRSGRLEEALELIKEMTQPPASVLASLLGSCMHHLDSELGEEMALKLSELEPENPTPFVILSNIYAGLGRWLDAERIRRMINERGLIKLPGYSSIEVT